MHRAFDTSCHSIERHTINAYGLFASRKTACFSTLAINDTIFKGAIDKIKHSGTMLTFGLYIRHGTLGAVMYNYVKPNAILFQKQNPAPIHCAQFVHNNAASMFE
jgi:hypothetical protein